MHAEISQALQNLELPEYRAINALFGNVLTRRSQQLDPRLALFSFLARKDRMMVLFEEDCQTYITEIGLKDALRKVRENVSGHIARPQYDFQQQLGDFLSEVSAVTLLSKNGVSRFCAIHEGDPLGRTYDYTGFRGEQPLAIEVKNLRVNYTALDFAARVLARLYAAEPEQFGFHAVLTFYDDEPPLAEQERLLKAHIQSWRGRTVPFTDEFKLVTGEAKFKVQRGEGRVIGVRGWSVQDEPTIRLDRFLSRVREKAEKARGQMKSVAGGRVLVLNINPPSYGLHNDFVVAAAREIDHVFEGKVEAHLLLAGHTLLPVVVAEPVDEHQK